MLELIEKSILFFFFLSLQLLLGALVSNGSSSSVVLQSGVILNHFSLRCGENFVNSVAEGFILGKGEMTG